MKSNFKKTFGKRYYILPFIPFVNIIFILYSFRKSMREGTRQLFFLLGVLLVFVLTTITGLSFFSLSLIRNLILFYVIPLLLSLVLVLNLKHTSQSELFKQQATGKMVPLKTQYILLFFPLANYGLMFIARYNFGLYKKDTTVGKRAEFAAFLSAMTTAIIAAFLLSSLPFVFEIIFALACSLIYLLAVVGGTVLILYQKTTIFADAEYGNHKTFEEYFNESDQNNILYHGEKIKRLYRIKRVGEYCLTLSDISIHSPCRQGVVLLKDGFHGTVTFDAFDGIDYKETSEYIRVWLKPDEARVSFNVHLLSGMLCLCNASADEANENRHIILSENCAMKVTKKSENKVLFACNDHRVFKDAPHDSFEDLQFILRYST